MKIKMDAEGKFTIPAEICTIMGIKKDTVLNLRLENDTLVLNKVAKSQENTISKTTHMDKDDLGVDETQTIRLVKKPKGLKL